MKFLSSWKPNAIITLIWMFVTAINSVSLYGYLSAGVVSDVVLALKLITIVLNVFLVLIYGFITVSMLDQE